jgi:excisionase family DNA binding protein
VANERQYATTAKTRIKPCPSEAPATLRQVEPATEYMTVDETSLLLRISRTTLWRLGRNGELPPIKIGRRCLYARADVYAFMRRHVQRVVLD